MPRVDAFLHRRGHAPSTLAVLRTPAQRGLIVRRGCEVGSEGSPRFSCCDFTSLPVNGPSSGGGAAGPFGVVHSTWLGFRISAMLTLGNGHPGEVLGQGVPDSVCRQQGQQRGKTALSSRRGAGPGAATRGAGQPNRGSSRYGVKQTRGWVRLRASQVQHVPGPTVCVPVSCAGRMDGCRGGR